MSFLRSAKTPQELRPAGRSRAADLAGNLVDAGTVGRGQGRLERQVAEGERRAQARSNQLLRGGGALKAGEAKVQPRARGADNVGHFL